METLFLELPVGGKFTDSRRRINKLLQSGFADSVNGRLDLGHSARPSAMRRIRIRLPT